MESNSDTLIKKIEIEDANVISETKIESKPNESHGSIEVDGDTVKKKVHEKITIDFMGESHLKDHIKKETNFVRPEPEKPQATIEQVREQIKAEEKAASEKWTPKDFEQIAGFLINLVDTGIATGLRFWSKDTSDSAYSLSEPKKKMLTEQLALILIKYNTKFSIEFMFLATIVVAYAVPFQKAMERRKIIKKKEAEPEPEPVKKIIRQEFVGKVKNDIPVVKQPPPKKEIPVIPFIKKEDILNETIKDDDNPLSEEPQLVVSESIIEMTEDEKKILALRSQKRGRGRPTK